MAKKGKPLIFKLILARIYYSNERMKQVAFINIRDLYYEDLLAYYFQSHRDMSWKSWNMLQSIKHIKVD